MGVHSPLMLTSLCTMLAFLKYRRWAFRPGDRRVYPSNSDGCPFWGVGSGLSSVPFIVPNRVKYVVSGGTITKPDCIFFACYFISTVTLSGQSEHITKCLQTAVSLRINPAVEKGGGVVCLSKPAHHVDG